MKKMTTFLVLLMISACKNSDNSLSKQELALIDEVQSVMQANSVFRDNVPWDSFKLQVQVKAESTGSIENGLREALLLLGDPQSSIVESNKKLLIGGVQSCSGETSGEPLVPGNIGYIRIARFDGTSTGSDAVAFAQAIQDRIKLQDRSDLIGWIVDLRGSDGNSWPMIAGLGPILDEGTLGYYKDTKGETPWGYANGASTSNGYPVTIVKSPYKILSTAAKVAVLLNTSVGGGAEVLAIGLAGKSSTKSFGTRTCGKVYTIRPHGLTNQWTLNLAVGPILDRNKIAYAGSLMPTQISSNETIVKDAVDWINN